MYLSKKKEASAMFQSMAMVYNTIDPIGPLLFVAPTFRSTVFGNRVKNCGQTE
jgi:hypothetical protein